MGLSLRCGAAEPAELVLLAGDGQGVEVAGAAKVVPVKGKPEDIHPDLAGQMIVQLGTWSKENQNESKVIFSPSIPADGWYDVYVRWYTPGLVVGVTDELPITIQSAGPERRFQMTQKQGNVWAFMGTYSFRKGTGGRIVADAMGTFGASNLNGVKLVASQKPPETQSPRTVTQPKGKPDDFDQLRLRLAEMLTPPLDVDYKNPVVADRIGQSNADTYLNWKTMQKGDGVKELWGDPPVGRDIAKNEGGGWPLVVQYQRLVDMAEAYVSSAWPLGFGEKMQGNKDLLADILYGLEFFYKNRFNEETKNKLGADWIANEMSQPTAILEIILLLYPHVPEGFVAKQLATIERMNSDPRSMYGGGGVSTGFNRLGFVYMHILRGAVERDPQRIEMAIDAIWDQLAKNDRGNPLMHRGKPTTDGFYGDGSFIQHEDLPYMTIYGTNVLNVFGSVKGLLAATKWRLDDPRAKVLDEWIYKGIEPLAFRGDSFFRPTGRSIGQSWIQNNGAAYILIDAVTQAIPSADPEDKPAFEGMVKRWMNEDVIGKALQFTGKKSMQLPVVLEIQRIMNDPKIKATPAPLGPFVFYNTDYVVYHRPAFAASLSMSSTRIATHEMMQDVNKRGWYQGDGALFIHTTDPWRYNGDFWPTVNPYRLPGTTVDTQTRKEGDSGPANQGKPSTSDWAGGVALGDYAMASMELHAQESSLKARKAWFFVGDQIACLGAAITASDDRVIETVVENAKLNAAGDNAFVFNGTTEPAKLGWTATLSDGKWAHLAGSVAGADMGWYFPQPTTVQALREARTGKWQDLFSRDKEKGEKTNNFLTLWIDHGKSPQGAGYAYVILPGKTRDATAAYAAKPELEILTNTDKVQGVRAAGAGITGINFWEAGEAGGVTSSGKAAVLVEETKEMIRIAVSDPTQLEKGVDLTFAGLNAGKEKASNPRVKVSSLRPLRLAIDLEGTFGSPVIAEFQK